jgi:hypothetical protein
MEAAGARTLQEDEQQMARGGLSLVEREDREAVLLQWERKIEQAERGSKRFVRAEPVATPVPAPVPVTAGERRTITITGQPTPARRRPTLAERHIAAQPDRIALWAFLLGLLLIAVAAGTAHA